MHNAPHLPKQLQSGVFDKAIDGQSQMQPLKISVSNEDVTDASCDVLALKYADGFHGADYTVAQKLGYSGNLEGGTYHLLSGEGVSARNVLFVGVGNLYEFRYRQMREFSKTIVELVCSEVRFARTLGITLHGPGYGLDERESFFSLLSGLMEARRTRESLLGQVVFLEKSAPVFERLAVHLEKFDAEFGTSDKLLLDDMPTIYIGEADLNKGHRILGRSWPDEIPQKKMFVAMPFSEDFLDEYEIGIVEAAHDNDLICERLDLEAFVGDVVTEIKRRIVDANVVIALINRQNANVFLEIGYAMALEKPLIIVVKEGEEVPFDIRGMKHIEYRRIGDLREKLKREISGLKEIDAI